MFHGFGVFFYIGFGIVLDGVGGCLIVVEAFLRMTKSEIDDK